MGIGQIVGLAALVLLLAGVIEYLVEWLFGEWKNGKTIKLIGLACGLAVALGCKLGLIGAIAGDLGLGLKINQWVDYCITGVITGMGSGYVHQLLKRWLPVEFDDG